MAHLTQMTNSRNNSTTSAEPCCRIVWLLTFIAIVLLVGRGAAADDWIHLNLTDAAWTQPIGPGPPNRLPPVDSVSYDAATNETVHWFGATGASFAGAPADYRESGNDAETPLNESALKPLPYWFEDVNVGYDGGFVIASKADLDLQTSDAPFLLRLNGWGQIRHTLRESGPNQDLNQFQLKRARLVFSGSAFTPDFTYFVQLDGRSSSGDDIRLLDYFFTFDFGRHLWGLKRRTIRFKAGKYKMPFTMARYLSGREFEFTDRSVASTFFDVNRSLAWGLYGETDSWAIPARWEMAIFNGLVTGGAETGSSGSLDNNFAYSARVFTYPVGDWGDAGLADLSHHNSPAVRVGGGFAFSTLDRSGTTEFGRIRVVDSGVTLASLLPHAVTKYSVSLFAIDASLKFRGLSVTAEYYLRNTSSFSGAVIPGLFDHGAWFQMGYFVIPETLQILARWSRVQGDSGTLGVMQQSFDEVAGGLVWYINDQHAKWTLDLTNLNGAPVSSTALDIAPGDTDWLLRSQIQFSF